MRVWRRKKDGGGKGGGECRFGGEGKRFALTRIGGSRISNDGEGKKKDSKLSQPPSAETVPACITMGEKKD